MHVSCQENWGNPLQVNLLTIAKLWLLEIAVDHADLVSRRREALLQTQGNRDRPMSSASAADADVQIAAALTLKQGN